MNILNLYFYNVAKFWQRQSASNSNVRLLNYQLAYLSQVPAKELDASQHPASHKSMQKQTNFQMKISWALPNQMLRLSAMAGKRSFDPELPKPKQILIDFARPNLRRSSTPALQLLWQSHVNPSPDLDGLEPKECSHSSEPGLPSQRLASPFLRKMEVSWIKPRTLANVRTLYCCHPAHLLTIPISEGPSSWKAVNRQILKAFADLWKEHISLDAQICQGP